LPFYVFRFSLVIATSVVGFIETTIEWEVRNYLALRDSGLLVGVRRFFSKDRRRGAGGQF
jgi:hypothetical protein